MDIDLKPTGRGFIYGEFLDYYGNRCSVQESSLAESDCIWLGRDPDRMHLTQDMAAALIPLLQRFVERGDLRAEPETGGEVAE